mmetsp:Transcript_12658/g.10815  ORF Transcript_12658/g.10815 Transcript_12658/m.10815 type:complete len:121 (+) Transcript_12658:92-454(+)
MIAQPLKSPLAFCIFSALVLLASADVPKPFSLSYMGGGFPITLSDSGKKYNIAIAPYMSVNMFFVCEDDPSYTHGLVCDDDIECDESEFGTEFYGGFFDFDPEDTRYLNLNFKTPNDIKI